MSESFYIRTFLYIHNTRYGFQKMEETFEIKTSGKFSYDI